MALPIDPQAVVRWGRANQRAWLLDDGLYWFLKRSGICKDLTEEEHKESCDFLESMLPGTGRILAFQKRTNRSVWRLTNESSSAPTKHIGEQYEQDYGILLEPRLTYKTSRIKGLVIFAILIDPNIRITLGRATINDSMQTLHGVKTELERNPVLKNAFGDLRAWFDMWKEEMVTIADRKGGYNEPTVDTTGLNTSKTGTHPDLVIMDDLVHEKNYESVKEMESAKQLVKSYSMIVERWGSMLVVGTRWGDNDLYGHLLEHDDVLERSGKNRQYRTFIRGAYKEDGSLYYPVILPEKRLEHLRNSLDPKMFSACILNVTRHEGEDIFTLAYIRHFDGEIVGGIFPRLLFNDQSQDNAGIIARFGSSIPVSIVHLVDPAPTVGPKSDYTGVVVIAFDQHRNWWVLHAVEFKKLPSDRLNYLLWLAGRFPPSIVALENSDMEAPLYQDKLAAAGHECKVVSFNPRLDRRRITADAGLSPRGKNSKEAQIQATEPALRGGRVWFNRGETSALVTRLRKYPYVDHDDVLDAFSMANAYETESVSSLVIDIDDLYERIEEREYRLEGLNMDGTEVYDDDMPRTHTTLLTRSASARVPRRALTPGKNQRTLRA
jgi:hypothetical protein